MRGLSPPAEGFLNRKLRSLLLGVKPLNVFMPKIVVFEPAALKYPLGEKIYAFFRNKPVEIVKSSLAGFSRRLTEYSEKQRYAYSKTVLAVTRNQQKKLDVCKPSADYEFALVSNCPGSCEYCYLQTNQSYKPYLKAYVNLDEIWDTLLAAIPPDTVQPVTFEAASNGDPLGIEHITGSVGATIEFFSRLEKGRLRIVTKFNNVDLITGKEHNGHTRFRISINTGYVIKQFEHRTSTMEERLDAAGKLAAAGYPLGFIVAPIMMHENWEKEYEDMFKQVHQKLHGLGTTGMTFELIQHRYTLPAKQRILERFPNTKLNMDETKRELKWGKYGKFKYVYPREDQKSIRESLTTMIQNYFPEAVIDYFT